MLRADDLEGFEHSLFEQLGVRLEFIGVEQAHRVDHGAPDDLDLVQFVRRLGTFILLFR